MEYKVLTLVLFPINGRERKQLKFLNSRDSVLTQKTAVFSLITFFFFFWRITAIDLLLGYHPFEKSQQGVESHWGSGAYIVKQAVVCLLVPAMLAWGNFNQKIGIVGQEEQNLMLHLR